MKQIFKITTYSLFIALTLSTTHAFGMKSLFEESKEQEFYTPGTQQHSQQMPSASAVLTPQAIQGLVIAQAAWQNMQAEEHKTKVKECTIVKDYRDEPLFKLLYDILTTIPPELINTILDYARFTGMEEKTIHIDRCNTETLTEIAPGIVACAKKAWPYSSSPHEGLFIWDTTTGEQKTTTSTGSSFWGLLDDIESFLEGIFKRDHLLEGFKIEKIIPLDNNTLVLACNNGIILFLNWKTDTIQKKIDNVHSKQNIVALVKLLDGKRFVSADTNKLVVWDSKTGDSIKSLIFNEEKNHSIEIKNIIALSDHEVAVALQNNYLNEHTFMNIVVIDLDSKENNHTTDLIPIENFRYLESYNPKVQMVLAAKQIIASKYRNYEIKLWNYKTHQLISTIQTQSEVWQYVNGPESDQLSLGLKDGTIVIYNISTGKLNKKIEAHNYWIQGLILLAGNRIASAAYKDITFSTEEIKIWE